MQNVYLNSYTLTHWEHWEADGRGKRLSMQPSRNPMMPAKHLQIFSWAESPEPQTSYQLHAETLNTQLNLADTQLNTTDAKGK